MRYVYILKCCDDKLYVGTTNNLQKRIKEHTSGKVTFTANQLHIVLLFYGAFKNEKDAWNREQYFKTG